MIYPISWAHAAPYLGAAFALAYLLGSIPFGLILTRLAGRGDIRAIGSGNIGATNVLRTGSKPLAAATLLLDAGKGAAAVSIAAWWGPDMEVVAALGALVGHLFPVWLRFRGGKGVATGLGILLGLSWPAGALAWLVWLPGALAPPGRRRAPRPPAASRRCRRWPRSGSRRSGSGCSPIRRRWSSRSSWRRWSGCAMPAMSAGCWPGPSPASAARAGDPGRRVSGPAQARAQRGRRAAHLYAADGAFRDRRRGARRNARHVGAGRSPAPAPALPRRTGRDRARRARRARRAGGLPGGWRPPRRPGPAPPTPAPPPGPARKDGPRPSSPRSTRSAGG